MNPLKDKNFALHELDVLADRIDSAHKALMLLASTIAGSQARTSGYEILDDDGVRVDLSEIAKQLRAISNALE